MESILRFPFIPLPLMYFTSRILVFRIGKVIGGLVLSKVALELGYVLMDDLTRAVAPFYYPPSGGINEGWFSQPPTPTPPPENSGVGLIPGAQSEGESPDPNHYASGSSQAGKKKIRILFKEEELTRQKGDEEEAESEEKRKPKIQKEPSPAHQWETGPPKGF
ncbi:hypothetical protein RIF29_45475 [Crotalaria pallida]